MVKSPVRTSEGEWWWRLVISRGELRDCGDGSKGAQDLPKEGLFGLGGRLAMTAVATGELVVGGGVAVLTR